MIEIVAFAGPLADASEHRITAVGLGDVVDEFHDQHGLANASAAEQADLAALGVRCSRSTTLMPVTGSRFRRLVDECRRGRWIGEAAWPSTGPRSSIGSPMTFMMRPSVSGPTGTVIGAPVSLTSLPRTSPSVASIAMVRTVLSPRCCATSSTRRLPVFSVLQRVQNRRQSPRTERPRRRPVTWVTSPTALFAMLSAPLQWFVALKRLSARDDFDKLLRDHRLTRPVIVQRQACRSFRRRCGRIVHRASSGAMLGRGVFKQRLNNLHASIARQQLGQDAFLVRLVFVNAPPRSTARRLRLRQLLPG